MKISKRTITAGVVALALCGVANAQMTILIKPECFSTSTVEDGMEMTGRVAILDMIDIHGTQMRFYRNKENGAWAAFVVPPDTRGLAMCEIGSSSTGSTFDENGLPPIVRSPILLAPPKQTPVLGTGKLIGA